MQSFGSVTKYLIANAVPQAVVDLLKAVEVEIQYRIVAAVTRNRKQMIGDRAAVRKAGELVVVGLVDGGLLTGFDDACRLPRTAKYRRGKQRHHQCQ